MYFFEIVNKTGFPKKRARKQQITFLASCIVRQISLSLSSPRLSSLSLLSLSPLSLSSLSLLSLPPLSVSPCFKFSLRDLGAQSKHSPRGGGQKHTRQLYPRLKERGMAMATRNLSALSVPAAEEAVLRETGGDSVRFILRNRNWQIELQSGFGQFGLKYWLCELFLAALPHRQLWSVSVGSLGGLRDMSSTLAQGAAGGPDYLAGSSPGRLVRRVLSEERRKCCSPRPCGGY